MMPKTQDTRRQHAKELMENLKAGPEFDDTFAPRYGPHHARNQYLIWVDTYILPVIQKLIPELRDKK